MTKEDRRALIIEAIIADTRDKRIAWAERALEMGAPPSPNLSTLFLLSVERMPNPWEVDDLFRRSLKELGLSTRDREEGLRQYARDVAEGIVTGSVEPMRGAGEIQAITEALGYPEDMEPWGGFDEDLFLAVGADGTSLYYSGDDMISYITNRQRMPYCTSYRRSTSDLRVVNFRESELAEAG
jgi:hypothetical protein